MAITKTWRYDYADRCECSDDDRCGCSYPDNMARSYIEEDIYHASAGCAPVAVGEPALNFTAPAVMADGSIKEDFQLFDYIENSYALLAFYRADFSALCPVELTAFNRAADEFLRRGLKFAAVSVDSPAAHAAWRKMSYAEGGIGQVQFPLISDISKNVSREYGVLRPDGMAQRATFLIDKNFTVRYQAVYDAKITRNVTETLRVADMLLAAEQSECKGIMCWMHQKEKREHREFLRSEN